MDQLEQIKQKINVVDLIGEYLPLKKAGINFKANCPFHQENTPSFMVSPERGIWHCFGCQKGGDIFKFVMEKEGLEFREALELLAKKAGIVLQKSSQPNKIKDHQERLLEINQKAAQFYHYLLTEHPLGQKALSYIKTRGLTQETIKEFQIGYAPSSWESLIKFLKKRGFKAEEIGEVGLSVPSAKGGYDRFRGRAMFPLFDVKSGIIGFSGRILDKGEPKYINSPQTPLFDKSKFLFGIHASKGEIRQKKAAILVEGELDMLMSYQAGIKNIVATKGTALTIDQLELLKRYAQTLLLCFDADLAGDSASRRGIEMAEKMGFDIKVIHLEGAKDPAQICLEDPRKWEEAVKAAIPIYDYYLDSVAKRFNPSDALGKKAIFAELAPIWQTITDPLVKDHYIQKLAALLQVKDEMLRKQLSRSQAVVRSFSKPLESKKEVAMEVKDRRLLLEEYLLALLLHIPPTITFVPSFPESLLTQESLKQIYVLLVIYLDGIAFQGKKFKIAQLVREMPADLVARIDRLYLVEISDKLTESNAWQKEVNMVVAELKKMLIKSSLEKLSLQIKNAQEFAKIDKLAHLNKRFRDLSVKLKSL